MKMVIKHGYDEFFVHNSESCIGSYGPCNPSRTPKLWAITQENDNFLVIPHKHVSGLTVIVNSPGTPKLWSITHGNDHKKEKKKNFHHSSQICKSPWNPNTVGDYSCKRSENTKMTSFW